MRLVVKTKSEIVATIKIGKKEKEVVIQKCGPYLTYFRMTEVRAFTPDDIKFIMRDLPEFVQLTRGMENYLANLESNKGRVLEKLKGKYNSLVDATVMDMKLSLNQKHKACLDYEGWLEEPMKEALAWKDLIYKTDIEEYDPFNNNLLEG